MGLCFHQHRSCFQKPLYLLPRAVFPLSDLLTDGTETRNTNLPRSRFVKTVKPAGGHCIPFVNRIMNIENATKVKVKKFMDLLNVEKGLMYENQQPSSQQTL